MPLSGSPDVFGPNPYVAKSDVLGRVVAVLRGVSTQRGLAIEDYRSRAVLAGQIHELMATDGECKPGAVVERVALLVFFEVIAGGVILLDDVVEVAGVILGEVGGFNDTHMPNHQNICLVSPKLLDGADQRLQLGDVVRIYRAN